jgi:hypothetical protein
MSIKSKFLFVAMLAVLVVVGGAFVGVKSAAADCSLGAVTLRVGSTGAEVMCLQTIVGATADGRFGPLTKASVMAWQSGHNLVADGVVGPLTKAAMGTVSTGTLPAGCVSTSGYSPTTGDKCDGSDDDSTGGPLTGGAGSVSSYELMSFSSEEVGEDEEDVDVAGLKIEADDGSDLELMAVRLNFDQGTANNDNFDEYITEVALMLDGEEFARVDADAFDEDNDYEKTISLDSGAVIKAGETGELTVALTGVGNIDSNDDGETWTVDFEQIRFADADGTVISEDPSTGTESFTVELFASATDVELKASLTDGEDEINEGHVVDVDDTEDTEGIEVLAFDYDVEGDSDIDLDSLEVDFTSAETTGNDPDDLVTQACLWMDGEEVSCETFLTTDADDSAEAIVFDQLDLTLAAGDTYAFVVKVDSVSTGDALDNADTLQATLDVSETEADDESGEQLAAGDLTGSAVAEAVGFYASGIMVEFVSSDVDIVNSDTATIPDRGTFTIVFKVTAFDTDAYVDGTAIADEAGGATYQNIVVDGGVGTGVLDSAAEGALNDTFLVEDGTSETFTLTMDAAGTDAFASAALESVLWATSAIDGDQVYSFNMGDYETDSIFLESN